MSQPNLAFFLSIGDAIPVWIHPGEMALLSRSKMAPVDGPSLPHWGPLGPVKPAPPIPTEPWASDRHVVGSHPLLTAPGPGLTTSDCQDICALSGCY